MFVVLQKGSKAARQQGVGLAKGGSNRSRLAAGRAARVSQLLIK